MIGAMVDVCVKCQGWGWEWWWWWSRTIEVTPNAANKDKVNLC